MTERFTGFPAEAFEFYEALRADNTKTFWAAHKDDYQRAVRAPLEALMAELEPEFGPASVFRPYRDVRFSKDKTPYKDHQGAFCGAEDGVGWYVQVSADGLMVAGGWWSSRAGSWPATATRSTPPSWSVSPPASPRRRRRGSPSAATS
ncbi:MAG: DUF2461 domain-containing protein [Candidatus Nanopelagicales bacterium]